MLVTSSRTEQKAQTRAKILKSAYKLFGEQGFEEAKTTDIARNVGISHGTVFAHFDSKASILRELVVMRLKSDIEALENTAIEGKTAKEKLKVLAQKFWKRAMTDPQLTYAYHAQSWQWTAEEESEFQDIISRGLKIAKDLILDGVNNGEISSSVNSDIILELLKAKYFEAIRSSQYQTQSVDIHLLGDEFFEQYGSVIDYLLDV